MMRLICACNPKKLKYFVSVITHVCFYACARDLLMTNGWNEPEEPSMRNHPCEVKCKIDIWGQLMHCGSQVCSVSPRCYSDSASIAASPRDASVENTPTAAGRMFTECPRLESYARKLPKRRKLMFAYKRRPPELKLTLVIGAAD